jgi:membrane protein DedA with SNARE-associated domain
MGITEAIINFIVNFIGGTGYISVVILMMLESTFMPIPSEAVMPFAGFLVEEGKFSFPGVIFWGTLGSITGSLLSYYIGAWGGRTFIEKFGKYMLLDKHHLTLTENYFNKRGDITILICRFIPIIRHLISVPAGIGRMNLFKFVLYTVIGASTWNAFLTYMGYVLKSNWTGIMKYNHIADIVVLAVMMVVVVYYGYRIYKHSRNKSVNNML